MSYDMTFRGKLVFDSQEALEEAAEEVEVLLDSEDDDFVELWNEEKMVKVRGLEVTIDIDVGAPGDWWFTFEAIVEAYAELATEGRVDSWYDGEENESYGPDAGDVAPYDDED